MSALIQTPNLFRSLRRITETEALIEIGRIVGSATDAANGLAGLAAIALRLSGVHGIEVGLNGPGNPTVLEWHDSKAPAPRGAATGLMAANGRDWGKMRVLFEPRIKSLECPLRFARFLAQQAALLLNKLEQRARKASLEGASRRLALRLETRKTVSRAAGIVAREKKIRYEQGIAFLLRQARHRRRTPLVVARAVVQGADSGQTTTLTLRPLGPGDVTAKAVGR